MVLSNVWNQLTKEEDTEHLTLEHREKILELYQIKYPNFHVRAEEIPGNPYGFKIVIEAPTIEGITINEDIQADGSMKTFIVRKTTF